MDKFVIMVAYKPSVEVEINKSLLSDFVKKVTVYNYYLMTKDNYLSLVRSNKEKVIENYYSEMVKRSSDGKIILFVFCVWLLALTIRKFLVHLKVL